VKTGQYDIEILTNKHQKYNTAHSQLTKKSNAENLAQKLTKQKIGEPMWLIRPSVRRGFQSVVGHHQRSKHIC
jgi:hypothetical protein